MDDVIDIFADSGTADAREETNKRPRLDIASAPNDATAVVTTTVSSSSPRVVREEENEAEATQPVRTEEEVESSRQPPPADDAQKAAALLQQINRGVADPEKVASAAAAVASRDAEVEADTSQFYYALRGKLIPAPPSSEEDFICYVPHRRVTLGRFHGKRSGDVRYVDLSPWSHENSKEEEEEKLAQICYNPASGFFELTALSPTATVTVSKEPVRGVGTPVALKPNAALRIADAYLYFFLPDEFTRPLTKNWELITEALAKAEPGVGLVCREIADSIMRSYPYYALNFANQERYIMLQRNLNTVLAAKRGVEELLSFFFSRRYVYALRRSQRE